MKRRNPHSVCFGYASQPVRIWSTATYWKRYCVFQPGDTCWCQIIMLTTKPNLNKCMHFFLKQTGYTDFIQGIEVCMFEHWFQYTFEPRPSSPSLIYRGSPLTRVPLTCLCDRWPAACQRCTKFQFPAHGKGILGDWVKFRSTEDLRSKHSEENNPETRSCGNKTYPADRSPSDGNIEEETTSVSASSHR